MAEFISIYDVLKIVNTEWRLKFWTEFRTVLGLRVAGCVACDGLCVGYYFCGHYLCHNWPGVPSCPYLFWLIYLVLIDEFM